MGKYDGKDNNGNPRADYLAKISGYHFDALKKETESKIWLSAFASNNFRSDYHWHVDACYDEIVKRTGSDAEYSTCWKKASGQR
jgi:hypothetical protein